MESTGTIEAISLKKNDKFAIKIGEDWFNGKGKSDLEKGQYVNVIYEKNGKWNNITRVEEAKEQNELEESPPKAEEVTDTHLYNMEKSIMDIESIYQRLDDGVFKDKLDCTKLAISLFIARTEDK